MKKIKLIFVLVASFISSIAIQANNLWEEANNFYSEKDYSQAAIIYKQLMLEGESPALFYNYANACYKMGDLGNAILFYERALKLDPHYQDAKANLAYVNNQITDKIEPIEHFFFNEWLIALGNQFTTNQWAYTSVIAFILTLILLLLYTFSRIRAVRKVSFFVGIFLFVVSMASLTYAFVQKDKMVNHPSAIVMVGSTTVKSAPDMSGTELFVLHEGTKVSVKSRIGNWVEVRIADGNIGWLPCTDITVI